MLEPGRVLTRQEVEDGRLAQDYVAAYSRLARSHEQLHEAAEYVRDASLITADDAMLTDALEKLDAVLSVGEVRP